MNPLMSISIHHYTYVVSMFLNAVESQTFDISMEQSVIIVSRCGESEKVE